MELTTFVMLAALPVMLVLGALALWLTQKPTKVVAVNAAINDVVADNMSLPVTMIYLDADGSLRGLAVQIQRLHGRRRAGDAMLTGFDAFDERHGRSTLFDLSRVLTMVDAATGDLVISPATFCAERAGITSRPVSGGLKALAG
jgi:hypothetical protein